MGMNPAINRIEKDAQQYAGFNQPGQGYGAPQGYPQGYGAPQGAPQGYGAPQQSSPDQLQQWYDQPPAGPAQTGRMTIDDVVVKALLLFGLTLVAAAGAWMFVASQPTLSERASVGYGLFIPAILATFVLGMLIAFKKNVSVPLIAVHAVVQGVAVGAISVALEGFYDGIVATAVVATLSTFAGVFLTWKLGIIRVTSKSRRIFFFMVVGYAFFQFANLGFFLISGSSVYAGGGWLAIGLSVLGVAMASYALAVDFDTVERGIAAGVPQKYSWLMGHALVAGLVWLYIEFLRLLAILNQR